MQPKKRQIERLISAIVVAAMTAGWSLGRGVSQTEAGEGLLSERAKTIISQTVGIPADQLSAVRVAPLGDTGLRQYKLVDVQGEIYGVSLDASGSAVSPEAVGQAIQALENRGFVGKIEAELADRLSRNGADPINVVFWLHETSAPPLQREQLAPDEDESRLQAVRDHFAAVAQPLVDQLRAGGQQVLYQAQYAPAVVASVTPAMIRAMEARGDVERVYLERVGIPRLNVSRVVVQANVEESRGITGAGQRVGVVEAGRIGAHPNLPGAQRILCRPTASNTVSGHKTNVAGVIQSTHAATRGMAPAITIIDGIGANFSHSEMMAATDCVINNGASAINMSFGYETNGVFDAFARYVDRTAYNTGRTIVPAISNICANKMGSPEIGFNPLAVGAFGDNNTAGFADDIAPCTGAVTFSAYKDENISPSGDREEPDVVAPGHLINTTTSAGGFASVNGTSFAAPHVTGGVGLLVQRRPALGSNIEEVRAIMMAAARHNIEGASRLSERDGAGAIMLAAADRVLLNGQSKFFVTSGGTQGFPINSTFSASAGQRVRVVVAWSHKSPSGDSLTRPTTDLDLQVLNPSGGLVGSSLSYDNTYEIVEFTAATSGTYTARITNFRSSAGTEFIGLAVSRSDS